jgi:hypothetical protein
VSQRKCCCGSCVNCNGQTPTELTVVIAGMSTTTCASCDSFNGTFVLQWRGSGFVGGDYGYSFCRFDYVFPVPVSCAGFTVYRLAVEIRYFSYVSSYDVLLGFDQNSSGLADNYMYTYLDGASGYPYRPSCSAWMNYALTNPFPFRPWTTCDPTSTATILVTAL